MSHGPGRVQRLIQEELQRSTEAQINQLCWQLAPSSKGPPPSAGLCGLPNGELDRAFYQSFLRAVRGLERDGKLRTVGRKLATLAEVEKFYPFKTRDRWVMELRKRLLPVVTRAAEAGELKFSPSENEHVLLADVAPEKSEQWSKLEASLFELMGSGDSSTENSAAERREVLFQILIKGRELFRGASRVSSKDALGTWITRMRALSARTSLEREVYRAVPEFYNDCFPLNSIQHISLKTKLYNVVDLSSNGGGAKLTQHFKDCLLRDEPVLIKAMPEFRPPPPRPKSGRGMPMLYWLNQTKGQSGVVFDPRLDKLISRDVLSIFTFLRPSTG